MSTRDDYSADEWSAISAAPAAAALGIALCDVANSDSAASDTLVVSRAIAQLAFVDAPEIVRVLADGLKGDTSRPELPAMPGAGGVRTQRALIDIVRAAVRAIGKKSPAELEPFKTWLACVAARVCHSTHPGVEPMPISCPTQHTLDQLADVLGVTRVCPLRRDGPPHLPASGGMPLGHVARVSDRISSSKPSASDCLERKPAQPS